MTSLKLVRGYDHNGIPFSAFVLCSKEDLESPERIVDLTKFPVVCLQNKGTYS